MIILPPKVTTDENGNVQNSFPDNAPTKYVSVAFKDGNYVYYEEGDELPSTGE